MLEGLIELIGQLLSRLFVEVIFRGIFHPAGWAMLKILTLGRYPPAPPVEYNKDLVAVFPIVALLAAVTIALS